MLASENLSEAMYVFKFVNIGINLNDIKANNDIKIKKLSISLKFCKTSEINNNDKIITTKTSIKNLGEPLKTS